MGQKRPGIETAGGAVSHACPAVLALSRPSDLDRPGCRDFMEHFDSGCPASARRCVFKERSSRVRHHVIMRTPLRDASKVAPRVNTDAPPLAPENVPMSRCEPGNWNQEDEPVTERPSTDSCASVSPPARGFNSVGAKWSRSALRTLRTASVALATYLRHRLLRQCAKPSDAGVSLELYHRH